MKQSPTVENEDSEQIEEEPGAQDLKKDLIHEKNPLDMSQTNIKNESKGNHKKLWTTKKIKDSEFLKDKRLTHRQRFLAVMIGFVYALTIFSRSYLNVLAPSLDKDPDIKYDTNDHSNVVLASGIANGISKAMFGSLLDKYDPKMIYMISIFISALSVFLSSFAANTGVLLILMALGSFPRALFWPASTKLISKWFHTRQHATVISMLGVGSRAGSFLATLIFAGLIKFCHWRTVFLLASFFTMIGFFLGIVCLVSPNEKRTLWGGKLDSETLIKNIRDIFHIHPHLKGDETEVNSERSYLEKLSDEDLESFLKKMEDKLETLTCCKLFTMFRSDARFTVMFFLVATLAVVFSFESYSSTWFSQAGGFTDSQAAGVGACLPLGIVVSLVIGGAIIPKYDRPTEARVLIVLVILSFVSGISLLIWTAVVETNGANASTGSQLLVAFLYFLWGLFTGYVYYIPQGTFALEFGKGNAAFVQSLFDLSTGLFGIVLVQSTKVTGHGWRYLWAFIVVDLFFAVVFMIVFQYLNVFSKKNGENESSKENGENKDPLKMTEVKSNYDFIS